jgi:N-alpha-acetyltransferase 38, NatC auxiliary subunit
MNAAPVSTMAPQHQLPTTASAHDNWLPLLIYPNAAFFSSFAFPLPSAICTMNDHETVVVSFSCPIGQLHPNQFLVERLIASPLPLLTTKNFRVFPTTAIGLSSIPHEPVIQFFKTMSAALQSSHQTSSLPTSYRPRQGYRKTHPFLTPLLLKTIRVSTKDNRVFVGAFKCTDRDCNIILANTQEYRIEGAKSTAEKKLDLRAIDKNRFLGLVCVPGGEVVKIEVEEVVHEHAE